MTLIESEIAKLNTTPRMCVVDKEYLKYLHNIDHRISVKYNNRPFVVLTIIINGFLYAIPLTSTTNKIRISQGKKPRNDLVTTKILDNGDEIADLLFNNMFPVMESVLTDIVINPLIDTYELNEERFIRKHWGRINAKAFLVYNMRYNQEHKNYDLLNRICCDFKRLEAETVSFVV